MLDKKEEKILEQLDIKYEEFRKESLLGKAKDEIMKKSKDIIPNKAQEFVKEKIHIVSEADIWEKVMEIAGEGFVILQGVAAKYTIDEQKILQNMIKINSNIDSLEKVFQMKSYEIEKIIFSNEWKIYIQNIIQAAPTGAAGFVGIPFNIVLSTFIQFRTVQLIAMHYGYDIKSSQAEMDYASSVYLKIISKGKISEVDGYGELIGKMMAQAELGALRKALNTKTYAQMAQDGGINLLYVQLRAIANKAARSALEKASQKEIENQALKKILQNVSEKMSQKAGAKAIPGISSVLSVLIDTRQIYKIMKISNIIYQKRFLLDKEMLNYHGDDVIS